jgi:hypothetical protein
VDDALADEAPVQREPRRRRRLPRAPVVLAAVAAIGAAVSNRLLFPHFSGDADEPVYRYQALMLLDGHITLSAAEQYPFFRPWLSAQSGDRVMLAFTWPWPAVLAVSEFLTGSMLPAICLSAAGATVVFWLFAGEFLDDRRQVDLATAIFTFCPFVLILSGTYLNYLFELTLELAFAWLLLRSLRTRSHRLMVAAGVVWSLAFFTRPYDGLLVAVPLAGYVLYTHRDRLGELVRPALRFVLGAVPFLALTFATNAATSGSPLTFPITKQSGGAAAFFFGERDVVVELLNPVDYHPGRALLAAAYNLGTLPTWLLGSWLVLVPVAYGAVRMWRRQRSRTALLVGLAAIWPVGYLFWFTNAMASPGAAKGLGPHYYVPMIAPLAIMAAIGLTALWEERRRLLMAGVALAVVISYPALQPKIEDKTYWGDVFGDYRHQVARQVDALDGPALVVLESRTYPAVMVDHLFLANRPDLTGPVLYAVDRGPDLADLLRRYPDREAFRIQAQMRSDEDFERPRLVLQPLELVNGERVTVSTTITNTDGKPHVAAFVRVGKETVRTVLDSQSEVGKSYRVTWTVEADDSGLAVTSTGGSEPATGHLPERGQLAVGASFGGEADEKDPDRVERRYDYRTTPEGTVDVLTGESEWTRIGAPFSAWLRLVVDDKLQASVERS